MHSRCECTHCRSSMTCTQFSGLVVTRSDDGIRTVRLNVPKRKNALSKQMYYDIVKALKEASEDEDTRVVVITGTGDMFSSGNDLSNLTETMASGGDLDEVIEEAFEMLEDFVRTFATFPKILVAEVNGSAVGLMVTILALFDLVYAASDATFTTPFARLGQSPEGCSTYTFPRLFGIGKSLEMFCMGKVLTAEEAERHGLVTKIFPRQTLHSEVQRELTKLVSMPNKVSKSLMRRWDTEALLAANRAECESLRERWGSEDCVNAVLKFFSEKGAKL